MEDKKIIQALHTLQSVTPSEKLQNRLVLLQKHLPEKHQGVYFPLVVSRTGLALTALLIIFGVGSGVVLAAQSSRPGNLLFPIKKAVVEAQMSFTHDPVQKQKLQDQLLPVQVPTPSSVQVKQEEEKQEEVSPQPSETPTPTKQEEKKEKDVKGASTEEQVQVTITPTQESLKEDHGQDNQHDNGNHGEDTSRNNFFQEFFRHFSHQADR